MIATAASAAPHAVYPPDAPQSIGQVLDAGFRIFKVSLVRCLLFGALAMIAGQLPNIYSLTTGQPFGALMTGDPAALALALIGSVATAYLSAVILLHQKSMAEGHRQSTRAELASALRRLPSLLGVAAISLVLLSTLPLVLFLVNRGGGVAASPLLLGTGLALVGLPLLWILPGLTMAGAVAVLTSRGPIAAVREGISLVHGSWWRTMVTFGVWMALLAVLNFVAVIVIVMALPLIGATDVATVTAGTPVVFVALRAIGLPFVVAIVLALYGALRVRRQGADLERRLAGSAQT